MKNVVFTRRSMFCPVATALEIRCERLPGCVQHGQGFEEGDCGSSAHFNFCPKGVAIVCVWDQKQSLSPVHKAARTQ